MRINLCLISNLYIIYFFLITFKRYGQCQNTPPHVTVDREWILTEDEEVGSIVTRVTIYDQENDNVTIRMGDPSSYAFGGREDGFSFFEIDKNYRVKLSKSLEGMAGENFLVGLVANDGTHRIRVDARVSIVKANARPTKKTPSLFSHFGLGPPPPDKFTTYGDGNPGPPLMYMDPDTVWEVPMNAKVGEKIATVDAADMTNTFLKFSLDSNDHRLVKIDEKTGVVTVTKSMLDYVGEHEIVVEVSNAFDSISEVVTLNIYGLKSGANTSITIPTKTTESPSLNESATKHLDEFLKGPGKTNFDATKNDGANNNEADNHIEVVMNIDNAKKAENKKVWLIISVSALVFGIPVIAFISYIVWRRQKMLKKRSDVQKELSLSNNSGSDISRQVKASPSKNESIISGIFSYVSSKMRRTQSNRYEDDFRTPNIPKREFQIFAKENDLSLNQSGTPDDWESPRNNLRVLSLLGEGCFGQVWKCEVMGSNMKDSPTEFVAVKTLKESAGLAERKDLLQELKVLKGLGKHPNVLSLLGCCTEKDPIFVILEYMVGGTLQSYLRESRACHSYGNLHGVSDSLTPRDLTIFALQIAKGMDFLSQHGIIHRDLAARNILIGENKICKVADFGFARDVTNDHVYERKSDGRLPIRWMAPESLFDNIFTTQSDVWSFGVLLWEIVTLGSTPYPGMSASEVMRKIKDGYRLEKPEHCKREMYNVMFYCWDSDQNKRPNFIEIVQTLESMICSEVDYIHLDDFPEHYYYNLTSSNAGVSGELL